MSTHQRSECPWFNSEWWDLLAAMRLIYPFPSWEVNLFLVLCTWNTHCSECLLRRIFFVHCWCSMGKGTGFFMWTATAASKAESTSNQLYPVADWELWLEEGMQFLGIGKLASLNCSWQSNKGTCSALGLAGIEPMLSKSESLDTAFALDHLS